MHPAEPVPINTWPALASAVLAGLRADLAAEKGTAARPRVRAPDPGPVRALKALLTTADAPGRWPGTEAPMLPRAAALASYLADALAAHAPPGAGAGGAGSLGADLLAILRSCLLASPSLCRAVPASTWNGLVETWAAPGLKGPDPAGAAAVLTGLVRRNSGGLAARARAKAASGLAAAFGSAAAGRADARTCATLLMAGAVFLTRHGLDLGRPGAARLAEAAGGVLAAAWAAAGRGDARGRDAAVAFLRAALAVGGLDAGGVAAARAAVAAEIARPGFEWVDRGAAAAAAMAASAAPPPLQPPHPHLPGPPLINAPPPSHAGPLLLGRPQGALLALAAALEDAATGGDPAAWGAAGGGQARSAAASPLPSPGRPPKRARTSEPALAPLPDRLAADPGRWAPVMCALLRLRGRPPTAVARALAAGLARALRGGRGPRPPERACSGGKQQQRPPAAASADAIAATWLLRAAADLAAYWPKLGGGGDGGGDGDDDAAAPASEEGGGTDPSPGEGDCDGDASDGDDCDLDADWGAWASPIPAAATASHWATLTVFAAAWFTTPAATAPTADAAALALAAGARAGLLPPGVLAAASPVRLLAAPPLAVPVPSAAALTLVAALATPDLSAGGPHGGGGAGAGAPPTPPAAADAATRAALLARVLAPAACAAHPDLMAAVAVALLDYRVGGGGGGASGRPLLHERARRAASSAASAWAAPAGVAALLPGDGAWGSPADPATSGSDAIRAAGTDVPEAADDEGEFLERALPAEAATVEARLRSAARARRVAGEAAAPPPPPLRGTLPVGTAAALASQAATALTNALAAAQAACDAADEEGEAVGENEAMAVDGGGPADAATAMPAPTTTQLATGGGNHAVLDPLSRRRAAAAARDAAAAALFGTASVAAALAWELGSAPPPSSFGPGSPLLAATGAAIARAGPLIVEVARRVGAPGSDLASAGADPVAEGGAGPALGRWAGLCGVLGSAARDTGKSGSGSISPAVAGALAAAAAAPFAAAARELGRLFTDADAAVAPAGGGGAADGAGGGGGVDPAATTPTAATPVAAAAEAAAALFDEDLDAASTAAPAARRSPAVRATARRAACLRALAALAAGPDPEAAGTHLAAATAATAGSDDGSARGARPPPPTALWTAAFGAMVDAACAGSAAARDAALALATAQTGDLLARGRWTAGGLAAATAGVTALADAWPRPPPGAPGAAAAKAAAARALGGPLHECLASAAGACPGKDLAAANAHPDVAAQPLPARLRAALANAAAAVLTAGGAGGWADGEPAHDAAIAAALCPLGDVAYAARRDAAPAAARMLPLYGAREAVLGAVVDRLHIPVAGAGGGEGDGLGSLALSHPQRVETGLATLALAASVDDTAETRGLHLLLATAAQAVRVAGQARAEAAAGAGATTEEARKKAAASASSAEGVRRAAAAGLRAAAAGLGYASRSAHLAWRLPDLGHALAGVTGGREPVAGDVALGASDLAAAAVAAVGGRLARAGGPSVSRPAAFLRAAAPALVPPYALAFREADLQALADACAAGGTDEGDPIHPIHPLARLLADQWGGLMAAVLPSSAMYGLGTDPAADAAVVGAVLNRGAVERALPDVEARDDLFLAALPSAVVGILGRARAGVAGDGEVGDGLRYASTRPRSAGPPPSPPPPPLAQPWLTPTAAAAAARKLVATVALNAGQVAAPTPGADPAATAAAAERLVTRGLAGGVPLRALTVAEARLAAVRAPRHRAAALGPVRATLALLGRCAGGTAQAGAALALLARAVASPGGADLAGAVAALAGWVASQVEDSGGGEGGDDEEEGRAAARAALAGALPRLVDAVGQAAAAAAAGRAQGPAAAFVSAPLTSALLPPPWVATSSTSNDPAFTPAARAAGLTELAALVAALVDSAAAAAASGSGPAAAALGGIDPLPACLPGLESVRSALAAALAGRGGAEPWARRLVRFAGRAAGVPPPARTDAARLLRAELSTAVNASGASPPLPWTQEEDAAVREAAARLVRLATGGRAGGAAAAASSREGAEVAALAAAVLAEAGPFPAAARPAPAAAPGVDPVATTMLPGADLEDDGGRAIVEGGGNAVTPAAAGQPPANPRPFPLAPASASRRDPATPALAGDAVLPALAALLPMLAARAVDGRPHIAVPAQDTLATLLCVPAGRAALGLADPATRAAAAPWLPDPVAPESDLRPGLYPRAVDDAAVTSLADTILWKPPSVAASAASPGLVGRWVRRLAAAMLRAAAAPALRAVAPAAAGSAAAAELLLPLALADAARWDPTGRAGRRDLLSEAVAAALLPSGSGGLPSSSSAASHRPSPAAPAPAAVRILLACLDHLRSVRADTLLARGPPRHPDAPEEGEGTGEGEGEGEGGAGADVIDPAAVDWPTVFWLDLPYLGVAGAALGAGCPTAALLYAELEAEARGGVPLLGGGGGGGGGWNGSGGGPAAAAGPPHTARRLGSDLGAVLLAAHRSSPDPDGIYFAAAAAGGSSEAALALYALAGDWAAVAAVTDAAAVASAGGGGGGGGGGPGSAALAARAAGLPAALAHMGCRAAVAAVAGGAGGSGGPLTDARAEAAWRMGQWRGVAGGAEPAGGAGYGAPPSSLLTSSPFNAAICACLAALEDGDTEGAGSTLAAARSGVVADLAAAAPVAAGHLVGGDGRGGACSADPAIVRLQMLASLEDAVGLAAAGAAGPGGANGGGGAPPRDGAGLAAVEAAWVRRESAALGPSPRDGGAYAAAEPLLALRRAAARALGAPSAERRALTAAAAAARRAGAGPAALAALADLRSPIEALAEAGAPAAPPWLAPDTAPAAPWRVEEAKLLWARGQAGAAVRAVRALLLDEEGGEGAADPLWRPATTALLGKWLGATRAAGAGAALATLTDAATDADALLEQALQGVADAPSPSAAARVACRASFRLADFADGLARAAAARRATPDWQAARAVVEAKARQAAEINARQAARAAAKAPTDDAEARTLAHQHRQLTRVIEADTADQARLAAQQATWTAAALEHYRRALVAGGEYDLRAVARLVSVFLEAGPTDPAVVDAASPALVAVPSHKFVPLVYQVASRLGGGGGGEGPSSTSSPAFGAAVARLMARLATDHPHHTLWQLYALANGGRGRGGPGVAVGGPAAAAAAAATAAAAAAADPTAGPTSAATTAATGRRARASTRVAAATRAAAAVPGLEAAADEDKAAAAAAVSAAVARTSPSAARLVSQTQALGEAYIELAALPAPRDAVRVGLPSTLRRAAAACVDLPPASRALPVRPDADYSSAPRFTGFGSAARFVGGINRPKLVTVHASDGGSAKELVKAGQDDPRQDAVMQQAWCLVTALLATDPAARARALRVRTYRVVPLSPGVGVLQWVEDTATLHDILVGPHSLGGGGGVHARHAPRSVPVPVEVAGGGGGGGGRASAPAPATTPRTIMKAPLPYLAAMRKMQAAASAPATVRPTYDAVCARFPPALRHWFAEAFRSPPAWHAARTAYTRSTAAASMAGYVIGLGDRHAHNILVDARTAEVIHIDLGVAFEQGRFLNVPEVVPFRLTRDVVDGMGPAGVEGTFRRCCEATLAVLRGGRDAVTTVVGVLVHDPLYRWQLTPVGARRRQGGEASETAAGGGGGGGGGVGGGAPAPAPPANADAARALLRVRQKLAGLDGGGDGAPLSVEAQVRVLLHEAADPGRLCRMYVGWAPFL